MSAPRVDFYIVDGARGADAIACRVAEKAFQQGLTVLIRTGTAERAQRLDEQLWTFSGVSFVPHALAGAAGPDDPVVIGAEFDGEGGDLLINLAERPPEHTDRFRRIAEIVGPAEAERRSGRERFRYYRDRLGVEPETHRIGG